MEGTSHNAETHFLDWDSLRVIPTIKANAREVRGYELSLIKGSVTRSEDGRFYTVRSASSDRGYLLRFDGRRFVCECKDYERWGARPKFNCKHGFAIIHATRRGSIRPEGEGL